jgi:hypothetical protein
VKCEFSKPAVMFLGHLVDGQTVRPNLEKVSVIQKFPTPTNADEVQRLLGVATYISKFIPRFSAKTAVLRKLLKADAAFAWTPEHPEELIQRELVGSNVLYIFDPARPTQIATDASGSGLGAVLLQGDRPIAYAARSLTAAEKNYSTIEKELLALVFVLRRFHFYTAGRSVGVLTDHQPLIGAARKVLVCVIYRTTCRACPRTEYSRYPWIWSINKVELMRVGLFTRPLFFSLQRIQLWILYPSAYGSGGRKQGPSFQKWLGFFILSIIPYG